MMRLFSRLRLTVALMICPELRVHSGPEAAKAMGLPCDWLQFGRKDAGLHAPATLDVEVQLEAGGRWIPGQLINGKLHWVHPTPKAADLEAICAAYERANQKVPAAIAALQRLEDHQVADAEIRPSSQTHRDADRNSGATNLRFRLPQSGQRGARL